jgi:retron-type reverse transcriptase
MPPGATTETVDAMALTQSDALIDARRHARDRGTPVQRVSIAQTPATPQRPVGLPTGSDPVRQAVIRLLLEADDDPPCSPPAPGFRPGRGCHTALGEITSGGQGVPWVIAGDSSQGFDSLDPSVLLTILRESCHEHRCVRLIAPRLKAGSLEAWRDQTTRSGGPPGGGVRPIRRKLDLDRWDRFVETVRRPADHHGKRRRPDPPYRARLNGARHYRLAGTPRAATA